jgi:hypothetical protein
MQKIGRLWNDDALVRRGTVRRLLKFRAEIGSPRFIRRLLQCQERLIRRSIIVGSNHGNDASIACRCCGVSSVP